MYACQWIQLLYWLGLVGLYLSMPTFEPVLLPTETSPPSHLDWCLKLHIACLQLETKDRAQARQDDLKHQIEMYCIDEDTKNAAIRVAGCSRVSRWVQETI